MRDIDNLCLNCFEPLTDGAVCSNCGYDNDTVVQSMYLAPKTVLEGKYIVGAFVNHESDAVTYMGYDMQLDKTVYIREFYPLGMANRLEGNSELHVRQKFVDLAVKYKKEFYKLWTSLEKMQNLSAVVPVYDVFEANGTVYAIIEKIESIPLREYLLRNKDGYIPWDNARLMFMPVLTTIEAIHSKGIIHGSITPDNLLLCGDGKVRLKPFTIQSATNSKSQLEFNSTDGYTALEQYDNSHRMCFGTDIYSFSACIYRALVGTNPPPAPAREANDKLMIPNSIAETIPMHVIKALGNGLQIYPEKRIKNISTFRELLDASPNIRAAAQASNNRKPAPEPVMIDDEPKRSKAGSVVIIVLVLLIIAAIGAGVYYSQFVNPDSAEESTTVATTLESYEVPTFISIGLTQSDVENNGAWNQQFKFTYVTEYSTDTEEGVIFKQSIQPGEVVNQGTEIVLTVSLGVQTEVVPDVGGLTLDKATEELEALGFKVSTVEIQNYGEHTPGTVKSNYGIAPAAGETVVYGEEIVLQVYSEVITTTTTTTTTTAPVDDGTD